MLARFRPYVAHNKQVKLERLMKLAAQADEVLLAEKLKSDTRLLLEQQRQRLEDEIRDLMAQGATPLFWPYSPLIRKELTNEAAVDVRARPAGQGTGHSGSPGEYLDHGEGRRRPELPRLLPGVQAVLASAADQLGSTTQRLPQS